ncbi:hypothetical protein GCM10027456_18920 [Kineosporia babensis]|uniref:Helix-turn-helix domain-containing protein n=1 Tax=Kineosporia babensis TaxID=499548 RepID=A0A9X1NG40_9ACTN|nr:helix-turn-helix domain-containing protein [Kineosporia babensis]
MTTPGGPTVRRILVGAQLRRLRESRNLTREAAGYRIRASESKISRLELGRVGFKDRDIADLLEYYGVEDAAQREALVALAREANHPGWWHSYDDVLPNWFETFVGLEEAASLIRSYEIQLLPGLLQTEAYARAVVSAGAPNAAVAEVERRVNFRIKRQSILRRESPPALLGGGRRGCAAPADRGRQGDARAGGAPARPDDAAERDAAGDAVPVRRARR